MSDELDPVAGDFLLIRVFAGAQLALNQDAGQLTMQPVGTTGVTLYEDTPMGRVASFKAYSTINGPSTCKE